MTSACYMLLSILASVKDRHSQGRTKAALRKVLFIPRKPMMRPSDILDTVSPARGVVSAEHPLLFDLLIPHHRLGHQFKRATECLFPKPATQGRPLPTHVDTAPATLIVSAENMSLAMFIGKIDSGHGIWYLRRRSHKRACSWPPQVAPRF